MAYLALSKSKRIHLAEPVKLTCQNVASYMNSQNVELFLYHSDHQCFMAQHFEIFLLVVYGGKRLVSAVLVELSLILNLHIVFVQT